MRDKISTICVRGPQQRDVRYWGGGRGWGSRHVAGALVFSYDVSFRSNSELASAHLRPTRYRRWYRAVAITRSPDLPSFIPQRHNRIHLRCSPRGNVARQQRYDRQDSNDLGKG